VRHADALGGVLLVFGVAALCLALPTAAGVCTAVALLLLLVHHPHPEGIR
jgi:hypothetical protein